jgi:hypothetical protein
MASTVVGIFTTTPFRMPREGCLPIPMISKPSDVGFPTMTQILVVPKSNPTILSDSFGLFLKLDNEAMGHVLSEKSI